MCVRVLAAMPQRDTVPSPLQVTALPRRSEGELARSAPAER